MRRLFVLVIAGLLAVVLQINGATARGGFGGGFHGGGFGGWHGGAGFHGGFPHAGFAPGFAGIHPGWQAGGMHWAGGLHPGGAWHGGWHPGWDRHRPWRWAAFGALGYSPYDYAYYNSYGYDCPLTRHAVWDGYSYHVVWTRSCGYQW